MNRIITILLLFIVTHVSGQHYLSLKLTQNFTKFIFEDSNGNKSKDFKFNPSFAYAINYQMVFKNGIYIRPEFGYKKYAANISKDNLNISWSFHYMDLSVGGGYIYTKSRFRPYAGVSVNTSFLFKADQVIGAVRYDLLAEKAIKKIDIGITPYAGVQYVFLDKGSRGESAAVFIELGYTRGVFQLEKNDGQKLYNSAISLNFGVSIKLARKSSNNYLQN